MILNVTVLEQETAVPIDPLLSEMGLSLVPVGPRGLTATITVGAVAIGDVDVENVGTVHDAVLNFTIPLPEHEIDDYKIRWRQSDGSWGEWVDMGSAASTATTQAGIATTQAGIATTQAGIATGAASTASDDAETATTQAGIATTQAGIATGAALAASGDAENAEDARILAEKWATEDEDTEVEPGKYSALHYAAKAEQSAEDAATFDPASYYTKSETYTKTEVDGLFDSISVAGLDAIRANTATLLFRQITSDGLSYQQMVDGVADEFEDQTGIDGSASSGERYDPAGYFDNLSATAEQDAATMAGAISGGDGLHKASAFDDNTASAWTSSQSGTGVSGVAWIGQDFGTPVLPKSYKLTNYASNSAINSVRLQFSDNGASWTNSEATPHSISGGTGSVTTHSVTQSAGPYRYWRLLANANQGGGNAWGVAELEFLVDAPGPAAAALISEAFTALSQPDAAYILVLHEAVDPSVLNTDIIASASRDDGTTWTAGTLTKVGEISGYDLLSTTIDVSGQPAGTDMRWKIELTEDAEQRIHAVSLQWS